jgi:hypothetical protein
MPICTRLLAGTLGQIGRVEPRRRVHPFVEVLFLDVGVAIEMHDADASGGEPTHRRVWHGICRDTP